MKVYLDACAIDWLLDDSRSADFLALIRKRRLKAFVSGDVVAEIASTPFTKGDRRLKLLGIVFGGVLRLMPTQIPILGGRQQSGSAPMRRRSMIWSIPAPPRATTLLAHLRHLGIRKLDAVHLIEAELSGATAFVTTDTNNLLRRRAKIRTVIRVDVMPPEEVLHRLKP
jgi:hypothetical protein